jgi:hypothetical protein
MASLPYSTTSVQYSVDNAHLTCLIELCRNAMHGTKCAIEHLKFPYCLPVLKA